jgi:predicted molibdopterin-dependent oxidoreductase YjgC
VSFLLDGAPAAALEGDTLLTAILVHAGHLRTSEFGDGLRAGFCLMGACQDCWVNVEGQGRVRACTTSITEGMRVSRIMVQP